MTGHRFSSYTTVKTLHSIIPVLLCSILVNHAHAGGELREVTAVGKAVISGNITYEQAKLQALNQARALAVENAAGVNVNSVAMIQDSIMLTDLVKTFAYGYLVRETRKDWRGSWMNENAGSGPGYPVIEVSLTGSVKVLPKSFFRNYLLSASLNKQGFTAGDNVQINIEARENMYVVVGNFTSNSTIVPVFPSPFQKNNLVKAGLPLTIPQERNSGFMLSVSNYDGHREDTEAFLVFAFPQTPETDRIPWATLFTAGEETGYADFFRTLLELPVHSIAQQTLVYRVVTGDKALATD